VLLIIKVGKCLSKTYSSGLFLAEISYRVKIFYSRSDMSIDEEKWLLKIIELGSVNFFIQHLF
jgi:hypothetical protein